MNHAPKTANATYCATLCDQWWAEGLRAAFIAPGSRSTPLALALVEHGDIAVEVLHDERSAAFAALGSGLASGRPAVVLCSSGTAGAHFYAAVIEADASAVPLIVVTADRPPELWDRGAPQTIDQTELYGHRVRDFVEPGPPDDLAPSQWRPLARRIWQAATGHRPGPVHANLSFRDPLTGSADELPERLTDPSHPAAAAPDQAVVAEVRRQLDAPDGVIIAGRGETAAEDVLALAEWLGWPIIADHRSGCRSHNPLALRHFDSLLRDAAFGEAHRPSVVLRIGEIVASKAVSQWLSACASGGTRVLSSRPHGRHIDPEAIATYSFDEAGVIAAVLARIDAVKPLTAWQERWIAADAIAAKVTAATVAGTSEVNEVAVAAAALAGVPVGGALVVSSSMPVRDVEWFGHNRDDITVLSNRGANGIDGVVATALGVATTGRSTVCLIGDVAFLHDSTSLINLRERNVDLTIVVTNNDGGGIFSFLPQHSLLDAALYEPLFGTPHHTDLSQLAAAHGIEYEHFSGSVSAPSGVRIIEATTDRATNLRLHDEIHARVSDALAQAG